MLYRGYSTAPCYGCHTDSNTACGNCGVAACGNHVTRDGTCGPCAEALAFTAENRAVGRAGRITAAVALPAAVIAAGLSFEPLGAVFAFPVFLMFIGAYFALPRAVRTISRRLHAGRVALPAPLQPRTALPAATAPHSEAVPSARSRPWKLAARRHGNIATMPVPRNAGRSTVWS